MSSWPFLGAVLLAERTGKGLGIVAGRGAMPRELAQCILEIGAEPVVASVCAIAVDIPGEQLGSFALGQIATMARAFSSAGVQEIFFAGSVERPHLRELRPDLGAAAPLLAAMTGNGDAILRAAARAFASRGLEVLDPRPLLKDRLAPSGHIAGPAPSSLIEDSIDAGLEGARRVGQSGRGQAALAYRGRLYAVEGRAGTNELLSRAPGPGAVLVKLAAQGQDLRFDLPSVGPTTCRLAAAHRLAAIVLEADNSLVLERAEVERLCERHGICLWAVARKGQGAS
ncbi:MAG: UDP-2,3-diacylglucosamine diphosphatase LpxI [Myxococcota bacterium]|nr:UDP-2,3-diacylglucosamine diphosphatase LpxI [Myxococcota bacterium]